MCFIDLTQAFDKVRLTKQSITSKTFSVNLFKNKLINEPINLIKIKFLKTI